MPVAQRRHHRRRSSTWLNDQEPELSTRLDLAKLLDTKGAGVATYTTDADTLANTQQMLGSELAERVNDISYDTDPDDLQDAQRDPRQPRHRRAGDVGDVPGPRAARHRPRDLAMLEANLHADQRPRPRSTSPRRCAHGLATATKDPYFASANFGKDLTRWFVAPLLDDDEQRVGRGARHRLGMNGASLLAFMMRGVDYGPDFLKSAADELAYFEKQSEDGYRCATDGVVLPQRLQRRSTRARGKDTSTRWPR